MIPNNRLAASPNYAPFQPPRNIVKTTLVDYHLGGDDIGDSSNGLRVKTWTARYQGGDIVASAAAVTPQVLLTPPAAIAEFSFCFDQDMRPAVGYEFEAGGCAFYWYNPGDAEFQTISLPGARSPRVTLDDSRPGALADSDVLITYLRGDALYFRQQRDAFEVEYELATDLGGLRLGRFGMNTRNAMQWEAVLQVNPSPPAPPDTVLRAIDTYRFKAVDGSDQAVGLGVWLTAAGSATGWPGCVLELSRDGGSTWQFVGTLTVPGYFGELTTGLPNESGTDVTSIFRVALLPGGVLESVPEDQLSDFQNMALVEDEQLQFANVEPYGAEFELDYLLRGRNGTAPASHSEGAPFTLLDTRRLLFVELEAGDIGEEVLFRATTLGASAPSGADSLTFQGLSAEGS